MNNLMKSANEKCLKLSKAENRNEEIKLVSSFLNDISQSISRAINPLNDGLLPFVAVVLQNYSEMLQQEMSTEQKNVFGVTCELLKNNGICARIDLSGKD